MKRRTWALALAALAVVAPALAQIRIGQSAAFTGPAAASVQEATEGARIYLDAVNAQGGIRGQRIDLISMDDRYDAPTAAANTAPSTAPTAAPPAACCAAGRCAASCWQSARSAS